MTSAAQEARYTRYATGNLSARFLLDDEQRNDPALYPPESLLHKLEPGLLLDEEGNRQRSELWQEIRI